MGVVVVGHKLFKYHTSNCDCLRFVSSVGPTHDTYTHIYIIYGTYKLSLCHLSLSAWWQNHQEILLRKKCHTKNNYRKPRELIKRIIGTFVFRSLMSENFLCFCSFFFSPKLLSFYFIGCNDSRRDSKHILCGVEWFMCVWVCAIPPMLVI